MNPKNEGAIAMVRRIRDIQYEQIKDKSPEELVRYFRERAAMLMKKLEQRAAHRIGNDFKSH